MRTDGGGEKNNGLFFFGATSGYSLCVFFFPVKKKEEGKEKEGVIGYIFSPFSSIRRERKGRKGKKKVADPPMHKQQQAGFVKMQRFSAEEGTTGHRKSNGANGANGSTWDKANLGLIVVVLALAITILIVVCIDFQDQGFVVDDHGCNDGNDCTLNLKWKNRASCDNPRKQDGANCHTPCLAPYQPRHPTCLNGECVTDPLGCLGVCTENSDCPEFVARVPTEAAQETEGVLVNSRCNPDMGICVYRVFDVQAFGFLFMTTELLLFPEFPYTNTLEGYDGNGAAADLCMSMVPDDLDIKPCLKAFLSRFTLFEDANGDFQEWMCTYWFACADAYLTVPHTVKTVPAMLDNGTISYTV